MGLKDCQLITIVEIIKKTLVSFYQMPSRRSVLRKIDKKYKALADIFKKMFCFCYQFFIDYQYLYRYLNT